jgi:predicted RNA-binding Zn-ribbon protein involved in translation (DUF1610 family)
MSYDTIFKTFTGAAACGIRCPSCFLEFAIPWSLNDAFYRTRETDKLYCPSCGETMVPTGKSEAEKLRDELTREKHRTEQARADAEYQSGQRAVAERRARAARGQVTKVKNRLKHGACPFCHRTFAVLADHMKSKHPWCGEAEKP